MTSGPVAALPCRIEDSPASWLARHGELFAEFGAKTQDSGNISYGFRIGGSRYFVKTAGLPLDARAPLDHSQRVALLRNAVAVRADCDHPALPALHGVVESPDGPMLFYEWCDGDLVRGDQLARFRNLPLEHVLTALDTIYQVHGVLAGRGWVADDFYDGCLIYDVTSHRLRLVDLDMYRRGPCLNPGRRFGSSRFMAPEEGLTGATIDERTTVYTLGRTAAVLASDGSLDRTCFRGDDRLYAVTTRACVMERERRFGSVLAFTSAWFEARRREARHDRTIVG